MMAIKVLTSNETRTCKKEKNDGFEDLLGKTICVGPVYEGTTASGRKQFGFLPLRRQLRKRAHLTTA